MPREVIGDFESLEALGESINVVAERDPCDEVPFRDIDGKPLAPGEMLELVREIECETGRKLIFRRGERRRAA